MSARSGVKEGNIVEGILAMYIAAIFADNDNGTNVTTAKRFLGGRRRDKSLGILAMDKNHNLRSRVKRVGGTAYSELDTTFPDKSFEYFYGTTNKIINVTPQLISEERKNKPNRGKGLKTGKWILQQRKDVKGNFRPADYVRVNLKVRLVTSEIIDLSQKKAGFGPEYNKFGDFGNLAQRTANVIAARKGALFSEFFKQKAKWLRNNNTDVIEWTVIADGVTGMQESGGSVKGDVFVKIMVNGKELTRQEISISVKADSKTVHNGGVVKGVYHAAEKLGYSFLPKNKRDRVEEIMAEIDYVKSKKPNLTASIKLERVLELWMLLEDNLDIMSSRKSGFSQKWSDNAWDYIEYSIFGTDSQYAIDITKSTGTQFEEISKSELRKLRKQFPRLVAFRSSRGETSKVASFRRQIFRQSAIKGNQGDSFRFIPYEVAMKRSPPRNKTLKWRTKIRLVQSASKRASESALAERMSQDSYEQVNTIFQIRLKRRDFMQAGKAQQKAGKIYVEIGPLAYIHQEEFFEQFTKKTGWLAERAFDISGPMAEN